MTGEEDLHHANRSRTTLNGWDRSQGWSRISRENSAGAYAGCGHPSTNTMILLFAVHTGSGREYWGWGGWWGVFLIGSVVVEGGGG